MGLESKFVLINNREPFFFFFKNHEPFNFSYTLRVKPLWQEGSPGAHTMLVTPILASTICHTDHQVLCSHEF